MGWNLAQPRVSGGVPAFWERIPRDLGNQSWIRFTEYTKKDGDGGS